MSDAFLEMLKSSLGIQDLPRGSLEENAYSAALSCPTWTCTAH